MSGDTIPPEGATGLGDDGGESLAGEYVLGLLDGADLLTACGLLASDPDFARQVADWETRLGPLFDAIPPVEPHPRVWAAIAPALAPRAGGAEVVQLRRRVRQWQLGTAIAAALAGVLAIVGLRADHTPVTVPVPVTVTAPPPLAAALAPKGGGSISVVYHPGDRRLFALAGNLVPRAGHDLELWVLPPGGTPLPLGVVSPGQSRQLALAPSTTAVLVPGSTIAVSLEPVGGSPTGLPTGPVLATAKISPA